MQRDRHLSVLRSFVYKARTITNSAREAIAHRGLGPPLNRYIVRPVSASKSRACREGHTSGPCRWLFSGAWPIGDVKSLKALHRYNVVKAPAFAKATAWQANDEHARAGAARVGGNTARVAGTSPGEVR